MRASTAINLGRSMIRWVAGTRNDGHGSGCALGMAEKAVGHTWDWSWSTSATMSFPCTCNLRAAIMGSGCEWSFHTAPCSAMNIIVHLFNYHVMTKKDWTMDQLIDWVRSVEPPDPEEDAPKVNEEKPVADKEYEEVPACK